MPQVQWSSPLWSAGCPTTCGASCSATFRTSSGLREYWEVGCWTSQCSQNRGWVWQALLRGPAQDRGVVCPPVTPWAGLCCDWGREKAMEGIGSGQGLCRPVWCREGKSVLREMAQAVSRRHKERHPWLSWEHGGGVTSSYGSCQSPKATQVGPTGLSLELYSGL